MTTTKKIIIAIIILALMGAGVMWFLSGSNPTGVEGQAGSGFSIRNFLPFGNPDNVEPLPQDNNGGVGTGSTNNQSTTTIPTIVGLDKLRKIGERPVAGAVIFMRATTSVVRFTEKATGNVYEASSFSPEIKRLTNETLPKIMRAFWLPDGSGFLSQSLLNNETIETSFVHLTLSASSTTTSVPYNTSISKLPTDIKEISISPSGKKIFYYVIDQGVAKGYISNPDGTSPSLVFSNFITEWLPDFFSDNSILLASKAAYGTPSLGFILNPTNKTLDRVYGGISGASSLARSDGKYIIVGNRPNINLQDISNSSITPLNIDTLPEKCAWDPSDSKFIFCGIPNKTTTSHYPDSWYQGSVGAEDLIQKINVFDLYRNIIVDPKIESGESIDVSNIHASKDGNFLIFNNKADSSLWMLDTR